MPKKTSSKASVNRLRVKASSLRWICDPGLIPAKLSTELTPIDGLLGQERALDAVSFGLDIPSAGYNIFVHGDSGSGKHNAILSFVKQRAELEQRASDWLYVQNFETEHKPVALQLPAGEGRCFKASLDSALSAIAEGLPSLLEGDDTKTRTKAIETEFREKNEAGFKNLSDQAQKKSVGIAQSAQGVSVMPLKAVSYTHLTLPTKA